MKYTSIQSKYKILKTEHEKEKKQLVRNSLLYKIEPTEE